MTFYQTTACLHAIYLFSCHFTPPNEFFSLPSQVSFLFYLATLHSSPIFIFSHLFPFIYQLFLSWIFYHLYFLMTLPFLHLLYLLFNLHFFFLYLLILLSIYFYIIIFLPHLIIFSSSITYFHIPQLLTSPSFLLLPVPWSSQVWVDVRGARQSKGNHTQGIQGYPHSIWPGPRSTVLNGPNFLQKHQLGIRCDG